MDWLDIKEFIKDMTKYIIFIIIILILAIYIVGLQQVIGPSMENTLQNEDVVILDKLTHRIDNLKRGDIISFYYEETNNLVKRIVGLPGEHIEIKDYYLYINGE